MIRTDEVRLQEQHFLESFGSDRADFQILEMWFDAQERAQRKQFELDSCSEHALKDTLWFRLERPLEVVQDAEDVLHGAHSAIYRRRASKLDFLLHVELLHMVQPCEIGRAHV